MIGEELDCELENYWVVLTQSKRRQFLLSLGAKVMIGCCLEAGAVGMQIELNFWRKGKQTPGL